MARRAVLSIGAAVVALLSFASAALGFTPAQQAEFQQAIEDAAAQAGYPGMMIEVSARGQGNFVSSTGVSELAISQPLETSQPARIGSNTKTFTATLLLQLVEDGRVGLGDTISEYVHGIPRGRVITIRELLNHTSGNPDLATLIAESVFAIPTRQWTPPQLIRWSVGQPRQCAPGKCWFYSNLNYFLLGRVIEKVTGRPLERLYRQRIFEPLGLEDTEFRDGPAPPSDIAHGYLEDDGVLTDATNYNASWAWAAGAMVSTLADLHTYVRALASGSGLLDRAIQRQRLTFVKTTVPHVRYGLGVMKVGGFLGHNGIVPGYDSMMLHSPSADTTILIVGTTSVADDQFADGKPPDPGLFELFRKLRGIVESD